jgi:hypothetical protein
LPASGHFSTFLHGRRQESEDTGSDNPERKVREDIQAALSVIGRRKWVEQEEKLGQVIDLSNTFLRGANLKEARLSGAILSKSDLSMSDLTGADLTFADLTGADLTGTYLNKADLSGSDLFGTDFTGVSLIEAKLLGVTGLHWKQVSVAITNETTMFSPEREEQFKAEQESIAGRTDADE